VDLVSRFYEARILTIFGEADFLPGHFRQDRHSILDTKLFDVAVAEFAAVANKRDPTRGQRDFRLLGH